MRGNFGFGREAGIAAVGTEARGTPLASGLHKH
jgi:hypothetical protein